jgi:hypothetical protein
VLLSRGRADTQSNYFRFARRPNIKRGGTILEDKAMREAVRRLGHCNEGVRTEQEVARRAAKITLI